MEYNYTSAALFSLMETGSGSLSQVIGKILINSYEGINVFHLLIFRGIVGFAMALVDIYLNKTDLSGSFSLSKIKIYILRAFWGSFTYCFFVLTTLHLRLSTLATIMAFAPLFVSLASSYFFKDVFTRNQAIQLVLCIIFSSFVTKPFSESNKNDTPIGFLYCFIAVSGFVIDCLLNKLLSNEYSREAIIMAQSTVFIIIAFPCMVLFNEGILDFPAMTLETVPFLIGTNILQYYKIYFMLKSFKNAPLSFLAPIRYSGIVFGIVFGLVFLGEEVDSGNIIGTFGIIGTYALKVYLDRN